MLSTCILFIQHNNKPRRAVIEHKIIAAILSDRVHFDRIDKHLTQSDVSQQGAIVLKEIRRYYYKDAGADKADPEIIRKRVLRQVRNPKHEELFKTYLNTVAQEDTSEINIVNEVISAKREGVELLLLEAIAGKDEGQVDTLVQELMNLKLDADLDDAVHEEYQGLEVTDLLKTFEKDNLIKVAPPSLNRRLGGGVTRGSHIVVVAYPETGKTLVTLTMAAGFARQDLKVLYIGNEDPIRTIIRRSLCCITGLSEKSLEQNPRDVTRRAVKLGYGNIVFAGLAGGRLEDIRALLVKHKPDVMIVDQIRNISTTSENRTQQYETVARAMRNFAREFDLVSISVTQGADSARNKIVLDMGDVDGSNVGIPGSADVMLMIGTNDEFERRRARQFSLAKNKIGGSHDSWPVQVKPHLSRVVDAGE